MRLLFVHHSFPGQFLHLVQALAREGRHEIVFISRPTALQIGGVHQASYAVTPASSRTHPDAAEFDAAMRRAKAVAEVAAGLRASGFSPDLIIGHEAWGETLNLADVWPGAPQLGYREYFYHQDGADVGCDPEFPVHPAQLPGVRAKNAVGLLALLQQHPGISPTSWQRGLYPEWAQRSITVVPDGVDLDVCRPDQRSRPRSLQLEGLRIGRHDRLVSFVARDLEPYRGFHTLMRAVPRLLARPDVHVVCLGGDGISYGLPPLTGTWRQRLLTEIAGRFDPGRLHFPGRVGHDVFRSVLRRSDVHTYLSYPFIASWSLREALACGCAVVAADTAPVREFVTDGRTGRLVPPLQPEALADAVLELLDQPEQRKALATDARAWAEANLTLAAHLSGWAALIRRAVDARSAAEAG